MASSLKDTDRGYKALVRDLKRLGVAAPAVYVGILQDKGSEMSENGDITLAGYAAANEFGVEGDGGVRIPERSFLRSTVDAKNADYTRRLKGAVGAMIDAAKDSGVSSALPVLEDRLAQLGMKAKSDVQKTIRDFDAPANAKSTLERKYPANRPLRHTDRMMQSIAFAVRMRGGTP